MFNPRHWWLYGKSSFPIDDESFGLLQSDAIDPRAGPYVERVDFGVGDPDRRWKAPTHDLDKNHVALAHKGIVTARSVNRRMVELEDDACYLRSRPGSIPSIVPFPAPPILPKLVLCMTSYPCQAEHPMLRLDPDRLRESLHGMNIVARVDISGANLPAAGRRNIYVRHHEGLTVVDTNGRQAAPNQRRPAIQSASHYGSSRTALLQAIKALPKIRQLFQKRHGVATGAPLRPKAREFRGTIFSSA